MLFFCSLVREENSPRQWDFTADVQLKFSFPTIVDLRGVVIGDYNF